MSASGVLELLSALLQEHQTYRGSGTQLILVLDSELDQNHEVYDATLRRIEGTYIAVDRMSEPRVKGALEPTLRSVIVQGLRLSALRLEIDIQQEGGDVIVSRASGTDPTNESERLIPSFVAALFSHEITTHSVAAISWTDTRLEILAKDALWQLVRAQLAGRRLGSLTTLVLIAGGYVEPGLHCEHELSIRYALTERGLSRRKKRISLDASIVKLVREFEQPFVLFLGAGASASARMPLGNDVRNYALEHFFGDSGATPVTELAYRLHQWVRDNNRLLAGEEGLDSGTFAERLTLERVLREEFRRDGRKQSPTLRYLQKKNLDAIELKKTRVRLSLRKIMEKTHRLVIVTVNFDTIIEDEFKGDVRVFATSAEFATAADYVDKYLTKGGAIPLLKLHGTLTDPSSIVADVDTRSLGLPSGAIEALQHLRGESTRTPWIYIGASMRDPDVSEVVGTSDFAERLDEWWVSPLPDSAVSLFADEHRTSRWLSAERPRLEERQITETADTFLDALAKSWPGRS